MDFSIQGRERERERERCCVDGTGNKKEIKKKRCTLSVHADLSWLSLGFGPSPCGVGQVLTSPRRVGTVVWVVLTSPRILDTVVWVKC